MYYVIFDRKILFQTDYIDEADVKAQEQARVNAIAKCSEPVIVCAAIMEVQGSVNVISRKIEKSRYEDSQNVSD